MVHGLFIFLFWIISVQLSNAQWVQANNGMGNKYVYALESSGNNIFAGTLFNYGVYLSTNNGVNWNQTSLNNQEIYSLAISGSYIFAGTEFNGVYVSNDNGNSWIQSTLNNKSIFSLAVSGNIVFAGVDHVGILLSTNYGLDWSFSLSVGFPYSLAVNDNNIYAGTVNGIFVSSDYGTTWLHTLSNNQSVWSIAVDGDNVFAGSQGVYISTNRGLNWTQTSLNNRTIFSIEISGNNVIAGTQNYGVFVSNNYGMNWIEKNEGLPITGVYALCMLNNFIFAGLSVNYSVYRRPLGELIGFISISNDIPESFSLYQNYPNPFNPQTKIKFDVPKASFTKLIIYDLLGREIAKLVNEELKPGTYEADWDGSNYSSGVYFYKIISGDFVETKKMVLMK